MICDTIWSVIGVMNHELWYMVWTVVATNTWGQEDVEMRIQKVTERFIKL
jgi:hypothetical protein